MGRERGRERGFERERGGIAGGRSWRGGKESRMDMKRLKGKEDEVRLEKTRENEVGKKRRENGQREGIVEGRSECGGNVNEDKD